MFIKWYADLNLNGLLVTRQIDNTSPGGGGGAPGGKLVPGSKRNPQLKTAQDIKLLSSSTQLSINTAIAQISEKFGLKTQITIGWKLMSGCVSSIYTVLEYTSEYTTLIYTFVI